MIRNELFIAFRALASFFFLLSMGCAAGQLQNIEVLIRQHNWPDAQQALEQRIRNNPRDGEAHLLLAEVYAERDLILQMNATLTTLRSLSPRYKDEADYLAQKYWIINFNLGNSHFEEHFFEEAVPFFRRSTLLDSSNVHGWQRYGDALFKVRRLTEAKAAYRRALQLEPYNLIVKNNLAEIYFTLKEYDLAIRLCDEILARDEYDVDALQRRAYSHKALGNFEQAEADFMEAALLQPSARLLADFGLLYFEHQDYVNAIGRFEEALNYTGNEVMLYRHLGEASLRIRNYEDMAHWYGKLVIADPDDLVGWKNLAVAYEALGKKEALAQARHYINHITSTN